MAAASYSILLPLFILCEMFRFNSESGCKTSKKRLYVSVLAILIICVSLGLFFGLRSKDEDVVPVVEVEEKPHYLRILVRSERALSVGDDHDLYIKRENLALKIQGPDNVNVSLIGRHNFLASEDKMRAHYGVLMDSSSSASKFNCAGKSYDSLIVHVWYGVLEFDCFNHEGRSTAYEQFSWNNQPTIITTFKMDSLKWTHQIFKSLLQAVHQVFHLRTFKIFPLRENQAGYEIFKILADGPNSTPFDPNNAVRTTFCCARFTLIWLKAMGMEHDPFYRSVPYDDRYQKAIQIGLEEAFKVGSLNHTSRTLSNGRQMEFRFTAAVSNELFRYPDLNETLLNGRVNVTEIWKRGDFNFAESYKWQLANRIVWMRVLWNTKA